MNCHGPCEQGRRACPCPQACYQPEEDDRMDVVVLAVLLTWVLIVILGLIA